MCAFAIYFTESFECSTVNNTVEDMDEDCVNGSGSDRSLLTKDICVILRAHGSCAPCGSVCATAAVLRKSAYFDAQLSFGAHAAPDSDSIEVMVNRPDDVELVVELINFMHEDKLPSFIYESEARLVRLIHLAEYYGVPSLIDACMEYLLPHLQESPQWRTVLFLISDTADTLPQSVCYTPCNNLAWSYTERTLCQDLEAVLQQVESCRRLASLPFKAFHHLIALHTTRVAFESTIATAISYWVAGQPQGSVSLDEKRQLAQCLRLRGLPWSFLRMVLPYLTWWQEAVGASVAYQALGYCNAANREDEERSCSPCISPGPSNSSINNRHNTGGSSSGGSDGSSPAFEAAARQARKHPVIRGALQGMGQEERVAWELWLRPPRERSPTWQLQIDVSLGLADLAAAYNSCSVWHNARSTSVTFAGIEWNLCYRFADSSRGSSRGSGRSLQLQVGVWYEVFGLSDASGDSSTASAPVVELQLPLPRLHHALVEVPNGVVLTRAQHQDLGDPATALHFVRAGAVQPCPEVLSVKLPGGQVWGEGCSQRLQRFLDDSGRLQLRVTGAHVIE